MEIALDKKQWYEQVQRFLEDHTEEFYEKFYHCTLEKVGNGYRAQPCPMCGHNDSCTIGTNSVHCFSGSCDWTGTHITAWYTYALEKHNMSIGAAMKKLEDYTGYKFPIGTPEEMAAYEKQQKTQCIYEIAEEFYHKQLMDCNDQFNFNGKNYTPLEYMLNVRKRKKSTLEKFKIGFSRNYIELFKLLTSKGYLKEEIKDSRIWMPDGVFVFFYRHPLNKNIVRINTKNPFGVRYPSKEGVEPGSVVKGHSVGNKFMYFPPDFSFKKKEVICVEGEHDMLALYESGEYQVAATGGEIEQDNQLNILYKMPEDTIYYAMYDNDSAGEKDAQIHNEFFADRTVKKIHYDDEYKDPDELVKFNPETDLATLKEKAEPMITDKYKIYRNGNQWAISTRDKKLEFVISGKAKHTTFTGTASYYIRGVLNDRQEGIALVKCKQLIKPLNFYLLEEIESYYNDLEKKDIHELINIFYMSAKQEEIIKIIAQEVYAKNNEEALIQDIKMSLKAARLNVDSVMDEILKEVNDIRNRNNLSTDNIPKMRVGQFFNVRNNDAYMYFTYIKVDGDVKRKLPYLLKNDGTLIRLDLLKRKDPQCLLLVDNKYELADEVGQALFDVDKGSLTQKWVEKFITNQIPQEELQPGNLIRRIEGYIRKFYYTADPSIYKVLALFIYCTYYYDLLDQVPYLYLNGTKGSGKSLLDSVIELLAFNAKMALNITDAAIFRMLEIEGGTLILDELEGLTSKVARTGDSVLASILKGGYSKNGGSIYRVNDQDRSVVDNFNTYGPKVISNINGMDDVIESRCIIVTSYPIKLTKDTKMEDPKYYKNNRLDEIRELTSKCALSALQQFKKLHDIYNSSLFEAENARASQILTPLLAIAKLCDEKEAESAKIANPDLVGEYQGEYEKGLINYWNNTLKRIKEETEKETPEGIIKLSVVAVAQELMDLVPPKEKTFTIKEMHKFDGEILYDKEEGWFELNVLHFKCFIEEMRPGDIAYARYIPRFVKTSFKFEASDIKRRVVSIDNEDLVKEFRGNMKPKVTSFRFYFKDFIKQDESKFLEKEVTENKEVQDTAKKEREIF